MCSNAPPHNLHCVLFTFNTGVSQIKTSDLGSASRKWFSSHKRREKRYDENQSLCGRLDQWKGYNDKEAPKINVCCFKLKIPLTLLDLECKSYGELKVENSTFLLWIVNIYLNIFIGFKKLYDYECHSLVIHWWVSSFNTSFPWSSFVLSTLKFTFS